MPHKKKGPSPTLAAWAQEMRVPPRSRDSVYSEHPLRDAFSIRLLRLKRRQSVAEFDSSARRPPLEAEMIACPLAKAPGYVALSYSWKNYENMRLHTRPLHIGTRGLVQISNHLATALQRLCEIDSVEYLWNDAICVNQDNAAECNAQVSFMFDIYAGARLVYIWLAATPMSTETVITEAEHGNGAEAGSDRIWMRSVMPSGGEDAGPVGLPRSWVDDLFQMDRPWWTRRWILQEIVASKAEPLVLYGNHAFELRYFQEDLVVDLQSQEQLPSRDNMVARDQTEAISAVGGLRELLAESNGWLEVLTATRRNRCFLRNDLIYAVRGLVSPEARSHIDVDYGLPSTTLFTQITERLILDGLCSDLDTLFSTWKFLESPSWVCDFSRPSLERGDWTRLSTVDPSEPVRFCWNAIDTARGEDKGREHHARDEFRTWGGHRLKALETASTAQTYIPEVQDTTLYVWGVTVGSITQVVGWRAGEVDDKLYTLEHMFGVEGAALRDAAWPEIAHPRAVELFQLDTGHMGQTVSRGVLQIGDTAVHIFGCSMTMMLRRTEDGASHHLLGVPCLLSNDVCGCSSGEAHRFPVAEGGQEDERTRDHVSSRVQRFALR